MKHGQPQAKDISDEMFLREMRRARYPWGATNVWEMVLPFPPKVVLAKARALIKRGVIAGCGCGCRGDLREKSK